MLKTPFKKGGWEEYPRPQMKRESYIPLCGEWELITDSEKYSIEVPYPPESELSGVGKSFERYRYRKSFTLPEGFNKGRILLHFGAADQKAEVRVNGKTEGCHTGGYLPFSFDITKDTADGENVIEVDITDTLDINIPYGKQRKKRGGMWYTPISGLWQTVWLESVPENYIKAIKLTPTLHSIKIETEGGEKEKTVIIQEKEYRFEGDSTEIEIESPCLWTPEAPHLYSFTLKAGEDSIESYFALRTVEIKEDKILLNGAPVFLNGVLDQGYFSDGIYTPASPEGYLYDIRTAKSLGFNMLRKHIKTEPLLFYHYCDREGMLVFQDMVNSGKYSYLFDTVLPTLGIKKSFRSHKNKDMREMFECGAKETLKLLYNSPCVIGYTVFNEGWGQFDPDRLYRELRELDPTRFYDSTSGWFEKNDSDVMSDHIYFRKLCRRDKSTRPYIISEFGGYSCKIEGHSFNKDKTYGYSACKSTAEFESAVERLYTDEVIPLIDKGLCGTVITQLSDVEDEVNGFVTYDRQVVKPDIKRINNVMQLVYKKFNGNVK